MENQKLCSKCKKPHTGNHYYCGPCKRAYDQAYREANKERLKEYDRAYSSSWYQENKDRKAQYYQDHREKALERQKEWALRNPGYHSTWVTENRARVAAYGGKSGALKRAPNCIPEDFDFEATIPFYELRIHLSETTGEVYHVDHIVPLAFGGTHEAANLQVLKFQGHNIKTKQMDEIFRGLLASGRSANANMFGKSIDSLHYLMNYKDC